MNKRKVLKLANFIERQGFKTLGFNMDVFYDTVEYNEDFSGHGCGTVACVAGWCVAMEHGLKEFNTSTDKHMADDKARDMLGLTDTQADDLFYELDQGKTDKDAAKVLRHLAETGKVDWSITYD